MCYVSRGDGISDGSYIWVQKERIHSFSAVFKAEEDKNVIQNAPRCASGSVFLVHTSRIEIETMLLPGWNLTSMKRE